MAAPAIGAPFCLWLTDHTSVRPCGHSVVGITWATRPFMCSGICCCVFLIKSLRCNHQCAGAAEPGPPPLDPSEAENCTANAVERLAGGQDALQGADRRVEEHESDACVAGEEAEAEEKLLEGSEALNAAMEHALESPDAPPAPAATTLAASDVRALLRAGADSAAVCAKLVRPFAPSRIAPRPDRMAWCYEHCSASLQIPSL